MVAAVVLLAAAMVIGMRLWGRARRRGMRRCGMCDWRGTWGFHMRWLGMRGFHVRGSDMRLGAGLRALGLSLSLESGGRPLGLLSLLQVVTLRLLGLPHAGLHVGMLRLGGLALRPCLRPLSLLRLLQLVLLRLLSLLGRLLLCLFGTRQRLAGGDHLLRIACVVGARLRVRWRRRLRAGLAKVRTVRPWSYALPVVRTRRRSQRTAHRAGLRAARLGPAFRGIGVVGVR